MRAVLCFARRPDGGWRDRVWAYSERLWRQLGYPVYVGEHNDGPFNVSAARNRAVALASQAAPWDVAVILDADVLLGSPAVQLRQAISVAHATGRITFGQTRRRGLSATGTARLLSGEPLQEWMVEETNEHNHSNVVAVSQRLWAETRGYDERFVGWGWDDMAFMACCEALAGFERVEGDVYHLWHPRSLETNEGQPFHGQNWQLYDLYAEARVNAHLMRLLVARRDEPWWFHPDCGGSMVMGACPACGALPIGGAE